MTPHRSRTRFATTFSRLGLIALCAAILGAAAILPASAADAAVGTGPVASSASTPGPGSAATPVPRSAAAKVAFGTQFHGTWAELSDEDKARILDGVAASGASWVRIDISWSMIQPKQRGSFDLVWGVPHVDKAIQMANARGLKVLGTFWQSPGWASGSTNRRVLPLDVQDYAAGIEFAAARWAQQVPAWEIWNEPNAAEFLNPPDPVAYTGLLKAAYPAVKRGNPGALVLNGGTMYVDTAFTEAMYAAGAKDYFDVMAVHPYQGRADVPPDAPDTNGMIQRFTHLGALQTQMAARGDAAKPVWLTEFGWSTHENTATTPVWYLGVSEATQAVYLKQALELAQANYPQVTHAFWYTSRDLVNDGAYHANNRGLMRRDFSAKPALTTVACYLKGCNADAWVQGTGTTSAGSSTLEVKTSRDGRYSRRAYLRMDTSTALKRVSSATLRLFVTSRDANVTVPVTAYPVTDDAWPERGLLWPGPSTGAALSTVSVTTNGTAYEFDVTDAVNADLTGDGIVSLALADAGLTDVRVQFASRDNATAANRPQLVLTP